jgi:hypothetical protein
MSNPFDPHRRGGLACPYCGGDGFVTDDDVDSICRCKGTGYASGRLPRGAPSDAYRRVAEIRRGQFRG